MCFLIILPSNSNGLYSVGCNWGCCYERPCLLTGQRDNEQISRKWYNLYVFIEFLCSTSQSNSHETRKNKTGNGIMYVWLSLSVLLLVGKEWGWFEMFLLPCDGNQRLRIPRNFELSTSIRNMTLQTDSFFWLSPFIRFYTHPHLQKIQDTFDNFIQWNPSSPELKLNQADFLSHTERKEKSQQTLLHFHINYWPWLIHNIIFLISLLSLLHLPSNLFHFFILSFSTWYPDGDAGLFHICSSLL